MIFDICTVIFDICTFKVSHITLLEQSKPHIGEIKTDSIKDIPRVNEEDPFQ